jgi:hypothetical protein
MLRFIGLSLAALPAMAISAAQTARRHIIAK